MARNPVHLDVRFRHQIMCRRLPPRALNGKSLVAQWLSVAGVLLPWRRRGRHGERWPQAALGNAGPLRRRNRLSASS